MSTTVAPPRRLTGRLVRLYAGLVLFGVSLALMVRADLGLGPWDVFHQGVADRTGLSIGIVVNLTAVLVLLLWIPLRQRPGLGTISNVVLVGFVTDATLALLPAATTSRSRSPAGRRHPRQRGRHRRSTSAPASAPARATG